MTNEQPPDDRDDQYDGDGERRGSRRWLSTLLTALDRLDRASRSDRTNVDYSVSIRSGLEDLTDRSADRPGQTPTRGRPSSPDRARSRRVSRQREHVSTRTYEDELLITAELSGVEPEDVTVGFEEEMLVIGVEGRELERVRVPWVERSAKATIRNDVLTVSVTPDTHE